MIDLTWTMKEMKIGFVIAVWSYLTRMTSRTKFGLLTLKEGQSKYVKSASSYLKTDYTCCPMVRATTQFLILDDLTWTMKKSDVKKSVEENFRIGQKTIECR